MRSGKEYLRKFLGTDSYWDKLPLDLQLLIYNKSQILLGKDEWLDKIKSVNQQFAKKTIILDIMFFLASESIPYGIDFAQDYKFRIKRVRDYWLMG